MILKSKISTSLSTASLLMAVSLSAEAALTFTELPVENTGSTIAVSNDGTAAFVGETTLFKWSQHTGVVELAEVAWSRSARAHISEDGSTISFTGVGFNGQMFGGGTAIYRNGEEVFVPQSVINTGALFYPGAVSPDGKFIAGTLDADPAVYNITTGEVSITEDVSGINYVGAIAVSAGGNNQMIKAANSYTPDTYFKAGNQSPEKVDFLYSWGMSANGQLLLGELTGSDCKAVATHQVGICAAVWNKDSKNFTEIGYFRPVSINRDGSIVTGNGWSDQPGAKIWDSYNGTRDLVDVLATHGVDVSGWSDFSGLTVSPDGTKFAGYGVNPFGIRKPFVINVIAECVGF